jgi:hypothetical protein
MNGIIVFSMIIGLSWLIWILLKKPECDHSERIYYDTAGDELPGDQSEACFCKCKRCGQVSVIPSGFQSDAHFDNYLHETELGGSQALRKIKDY